MPRPLLDQPTRPLDQPTRSRGAEAIVTAQGGNTEGAARRPFRGTEAIWGKNHEEEEEEEEAESRRSPSPVCSVVPTVNLPHRGDVLGKAARLVSTATRAPNPCVSVAMLRPSAATIEEANRSATHWFIDDADGGTQVKQTLMIPTAPATAAVVTVAPPAAVTVGCAWSLPDRLGAPSGRWPLLATARSGGDEGATPPTQPRRLHPSRLVADPPSLTKNVLSPSSSLFFGSAVGAAATVRDDTSLDEGSPRSCQASSSVPAAVTTCRPRWYDDPLPMNANSEERVGMVIPLHTRRPPMQSWGVLTNEQQQPLDAYAQAASDLSAALQSATIAPAAKVPTTVPRRNDPPKTVMCRATNASRNTTSTCDIAAASSVAADAHRDERRLAFLLCAAFGDAARRVVYRRHFGTIMSSYARVLEGC